MRCLIVEDDLSSRTLLQTFLADYASCNTAVDGFEAVEAVQTALETSKPYDLICMDIMMPNMDGKDAIKAIRHIEKEFGVKAGERARIIMTTALNLPDEEVSAHNEGCEAFLVKPVKKKELIKKLEELGLIDRRTDDQARVNGRFSGQ